MRSALGMWAAVAAAALGLGTVHHAAAHDVHTFGRVTVAVGWVHEPAYVDVDNAVQVLVRDERGKPITTLSDRDLTVVVGVGSSTRPAQPLLPSADPDTGLGIPGEYEMHFIPTAPGVYTFHVTGTVAGQAIDDNVTAGDRTFNEVTTPDTVEFPAKVPAISDINTKLNRVSDRVDASSAQLADLQSARDTANRAQLIGIAALAVGALLGGAGVALGLRARRRSG